MKNAHVKALVEAMERNDDAAAKAALVELGDHVLGILESIALSLEKMAEEGVDVSGLPHDFGLPMINET